MVASIFQKLVRFGQTAFSPRYLLYTNVIVSAKLSAVGDVIQQCYQHSKPGNAQPWDRKRTAIMLGSGALLTPLGHFWYLRLDKIMPGSSARIAALKLLPDMLLFSPIHVVLFLMTTGFMEGQSWQSFKKEVRDKSLGLYSVDICLWTPAQFLNFYLLPTRFRLLYDNIVAVFVDVFYSYFRFDYEVGSGEKDVDEVMSHKKALPVKMSSMNS